jgi:pseudouridine synthase
MSRRAAEEAIAEGRVTIDGRLAILGDRVDVEAEEVTINGSVLPINPELVTYLVYKPVGVISTADDPQGRPIVVDLVQVPTRLYPVGRLDADSEGLMLLTNDGRLADFVTHPRYGIHKKYLVEVLGNVSNSTARLLEAGIDLEDGPARALRARVVGAHGERTQVELTMGEGRKRQVRRMMEAIGHPTLRLVRTAIGPLSDHSLKPGQSRQLTTKELAALLAQVQQI